MQIIVTHFAFIDNNLLLENQVGYRNDEIGNQSRRRQIKDYLFEEYNIHFPGWTDWV